MQLLCYAYEIKADTVFVDDNDSQIEQFIVTINNIEDDTLWIWFDNFVVSDEARYIKRHFLKRSCAECFSIFEIATDPNMDGCWWKVPTSMDLFLKCLIPKQKFTIVLYKKHIKIDSTRKEYANWQKLVKVYKQKTITKYCHGIDTPYGIKRISYPYDTIVYPI